MSRSKTISEAKAVVLQETSKKNKSLIPCNFETVAVWVVMPFHVMPSLRDAFSRDDFSGDAFSRDTFQRDASQPNAFF